jgi:60 kDa SS-A/Ro ribonucleoprotein
VLISNDTSTSMNDPVSAKSKTTMDEIARLFAAALYKKSRSAQVVSFSDAAYPRKSLAPDMSLNALMAAIAGPSGGTNLSAPLTWAFGGDAGRGRYGLFGHAPWDVRLIESTPETFDTAIFITDSESWVDHFKYRSGALDQIRKYKQERNPNLKCFFLQLAPYEHAVVPPEEPGCFYSYGWSSDVLNYIATAAASGSTQIDAVRQESVL